MAISSKRWGDDDDDVLPPRTESPPDENGVRTIIEWKFNEDGNKVKITKKVKKVTKISKISKRVMERKNWRKFGAALNGNKNVTYPSNEEVTLEDPNADEILPGEKKEQETVFSGMKNTSIVNCRRCGMVGHWTLKCPYKDTPLDEIPTDHNRTEDKTKDSTVKEPTIDEVIAPVSSNKYVPPSMRGKIDSGDSRNIEERDSATLRVTNISSETREDDLRDLFGRFGMISRIYLAKDRATYESRGFAFVSFEYREDAERALNALQGHGYDHLILKLEWAKPSNKKTTDGPSLGTGTTYRSGYGKALPQNMGPVGKK